MIGAMLDHLWASFVPLRRIITGFVQALNPTIKVSKSLTYYYFISL